MLIGKYRVALNSQHRDVTEEMLTVLRADPDDGVVSAGTRLFASYVTNVREQVSPLRRKQIDDIQAFGFGL